MSFTPLSFLSKYSELKEESLVYIGPQKLFF